MESGEVGSTQYLLEEEIDYEITKYGANEKAYYHDDREFELKEYILPKDIIETVVKYLQENEAKYKKNQKLEDIKREGRADTNDRKWEYEIVTDSEEAKKKAL